MAKLASKHVQWQMSEGMQLPKSESVMFNQLLPYFTRTFQLFTSTVSTLLISPKYMFLPLFTSLNLPKSHQPFKLLQYIHKSMVMPQVRTWHSRLCSDLAYAYNSQSSCALVGKTVPFHDKLFSATMKNSSKLLSPFVESRVEDLVQLRVLHEWPVCQDLILHR